MTKSRFSRLALCAAVAGLLGASASCSSAPQHDTVTIMVPWGSTEFADFYNIVQDFEALHPSIHVAFQATRAQREQLDEAVRANQPPDLAVLPSISTVEEYIHPGPGETGLAELPSSIKPADFVAPFSSLMSFDDGVYAVPIKADVKSLLWFPAQSTPPPTSPSALAAYSEDHPGLWCLGLASGPTSGWPGADAIADLLLQQNNGVGAYEGLLTGATKWDGAQVRQAWNTWGDYIRNGKPSTALGVSYQDASKGMSKGTCSLEHGALAAMGFSSPVDQTYNFVSPTNTPLQVSADFLGMFDTHNPGAVQLLDYLADSKTQQAWVQIPGADAFSAELAVPATVYPTAIQKRIAGLLQPTAGRTLCFTIADAMQPDLAAAFYQAVLNFAGSTGSTQILASNLQDLDNVRNNATAGTPTAGLANRLCSEPRNK
jgi:alpha-glucoside transport system substrate-binding protein